MIFKKINRKNTRGLCPVHDHQDSSLMGQSPDLPDVRQISGQIRRMGTDNGSSVILKQGLYILGTHIPQRITSRSGEFHSLLFQTVQGPQNAVVFQHGRHHMITGPEQSADLPRKQILCLHHLQYGRR